MNQGYDQLNEDLENKDQDSPANNGEIELTEKRISSLRPEIKKISMNKFIDNEEQKGKDAESEEQEDDKESNLTQETEENKEEQQNQNDYDSDYIDEDDRDEKDGEGREERKQEATEDEESKDKEVDELMTLFKKQDKAINMIKMKTFQKNMEESSSLGILDGRGSSNLTSVDKSKIEEAVFQRKGVRYLAYFVYLLIIALVVAISFKFLVINGSFLLNANANLMLKIDNCTLLITDKPESSNIRRPVYAKYRLSSDFDLEPVTKVFTNGSSDPQTLNVLNDKDSAYCLIELFVEPNAPIQSLQINCPHCNITQDTSAQLQIQKDLIISGDVIHANFKDIKVRSLSYKAITGYIQLNHIESTADNNSITIIKEGDIVIQSTKNFRIDASSDTQAFCFGGPFVREVAISNCSVSGNDETSVLRQNTDCHATYDICNNQDCSPPQTKYSISSASGNIYANIIPAVGSPISTQDANIVKGQIYDDGIGFSADANDTINKFKDLVADQSIGNPFIIFNLGNIASRSSKYTKWIISSTPSYSLLKPWWIGTFSASVLNGYAEITNGFLLPGFCPFIPQFTNKNLLDVQNLITERIDTHSALVTFVSDESLPLPPSDPEVNSGIFPLIPKGNPFDKWFSLQLAPNDEITLEDNNYTQRGEILAAVIVSLVIAAYITYTALEIIVIAITRMYFKLVNLSSHLEKYTKRESSKNAVPEHENSKENKRGKPKTDSGFSPDQKSSFLNFIKFAPSPSAFIDYLALILYGQFSSSVTQFYHLLFKEETSENAMSLQEIDPQTSMIRGMEIKVLYEKYCFTNHLVEEKLTDPVNIQILNKYGYKIVSRKDLPVEVFTKINIKSYDPFMLEENRIQEGLSSLELYIKENVQVTEFEEDQVEIPTFTKIYNEFCEYNGLPSVVISPLFLKEKYGIGIKTAPQQFIVRIPEEDYLNESTSENEALLHDHESWWRKFIPFFGSKPSKKRYSINISKIQHHFNLVMGKTDKMKESDVYEATRDRILYPKWWIWDAITVFVHLLIGGLLTVPLVGLVILNESQYLPWTLKNPAEFATFQQILQDPAQLVANLFNSFSWNIVLMILVSTLWIMTFFDLVLYYAVMEFPQDYSFKKAEKASQNVWIRRSKQLEWVLFFISLSLYLFYIGLVITWFLLGALINPNAFLPFASAAVTFVTFLVSKYNAFKELSRKGTKAVMKYIDEIFGSFINKVTKKLSQNIEKTRIQFELEKTKELTGVKVLKSTINDLFEQRIVDPTAIPEFTQKLEALEAPSMNSEGETRDPSGMAKESEAVIGSLKATVFAKIKEKYQSQLPSDLIELATSLIANDEAQIKQSLVVMKDSLVLNLKIPQKLLEIFYDLVFPNTTDPQKVDNMKSKIFDYLLEGQSITKDSLIEVLNLSGYLESNITDFVYVLEDILRRKLEKDPALSYYVAIVYISSLISNNKLPYWNSKSYFIDLAKGTEVMSPENKDEKTNFQGFIKFLQVLLDKRFEDYRCRQLGVNFLASIGLGEETLNRVTVGADSILGFLRFATPLIKHGPNLLQEYAIKGIFQAKILSASEFPMFCLKLAGLIHQKRRSIYDEADKYLRVDTFNWDLQNFIRIISFYSMDDFEDVFPPWFHPLNNYCFTTIAEKMKMNPRELLGLIDLINNKVKSRHINVFLQGMATRMNLKIEDIETVRCLVDLFLSNDEASLLHALKVLKLDHGNFLLMSKIMMNPLLMTKEEFYAIGVTDENLINQKSSVYSLSIENFMNWKNEMKKNITETRDSLKKARYTLRTKLLDAFYKDTDIVSDRKYQELKFLEREAELGRFYLTDFNSFSYSTKNLTEAIEALDNPLNNLREQLLEETPGVSTKIEYLSKILNVKSFKEVPYYFNDSHYKWIREVAKSLSVEFDDLFHLMRLFFTKEDYYGIYSSILYFFPKEKIKYEDTVTLVDNLSRPIQALQNQADFINNTFPEALSFPHNEYVDFPALFLKKMINNDPKINVPVSELMVLAHLQISKSTPKAKDQEKLLDETYRFALFAKGNLLEGRFFKFLQNGNSGVTSLLNILSFTNMDRRQEAVVNMLQPEGGKEHPIKLAIVLYGLLTGSNYKVKATSNAMQIEYMSIKEYLGTIFNAYPEAFSLFEVILERNPSKFFQKTLPIFRRMAGSGGINVNLVESLFLLLLGEQFNPYALANKLSISSEYITFFMNLARLRRRTAEREEEFKQMKNSVPFNFVLSKLKIKNNEFTNFVRLLYGLFENEESMKEIISTFLISSRDQNAQEEKKQDPIEMTLFKVIVALNRPTEPFLNMFKNKEVLERLSKELNPFFDLANLSGKKENAFIISALAAGNFLVLGEYKHLFGWIFPSHDTVAGLAILRLTMGLSGLLNPFVKIYVGLISDTNDFVQKFYPEKQFTFEEIQVKPEEYPLPNNSLAYAAYLTLETLDIEPRWVHLFLLYRPAFTSVPDYESLVSKEFILAIMLNFTFMPHVLRDILGLYEWACCCKEFYEEKQDTKIDKDSDPMRFVDSIDTIYKLFAKKLYFNFGQLKNKVYKVSRFIEQDPDLAQVFKDEQNFHYKVNQSILFICSQKKTPEEGERLKQRLQDEMTSDPEEFIESILEIDEKTEEEKRDIEIGKFMYELIKDTYNFVSKSTSGKKDKDKKPKYPGSVFTDLCILGVISFLKMVDTDNKYLKLYCLHQLCINIERKMFFDDVFYKMSKFKLMKLLAISTKLNFSNTFEWCVIGSLFSEDYIFEMEMAQLIPDKDEKDKAKEQAMIKHCRDFGFGVKKSAGVRVGDLGVHPATFENYISLAENLLKHGDVINMNSELGLYEAYLYNSSDIEELQSKNTDQKHLFEMSKGKEKDLLSSKEIVQIVHGPTGPKKLKKRRVNYKTANKTVQEGIEEIQEDLEVSIELTQEEIGDIHDLRTGLDFKTLKKKADEFEGTLINSYMQLIMGIVQNNDQMLREMEDNIFNKNGQTGEMWSNLNGILSLRKDEKFDSTKLRQYLDRLSRDIKSDIPLLGEILSFLLSGQGTLDETNRMLGITGQVKEFLMNSIQENESYEGRNLKSKLLNTKLLDLPKEQIEALETLKNIYNFKKNKGWKKAAILLSTKDSKTINEPKVDPKKVAGQASANPNKPNEANVDPNKPSEGNIAQKKDNETNVPEYPLLKLIEHINFTKLKRKVTANQGQKILIAIGKLREGDEIDSITEIFIDIIMNLEYYKEFKEKENDLALRHFIIQLLIHGDFPRIFDMLVLNTPSEELVKKKEYKTKKLIRELLPKVKFQSQDVLNNVLALLGIIDNNSSKKSIELFKIFITVANGNLASFRKRKTYKTTIQSICNYMTNSGLFSFEELPKLNPKRFCQLLLGVLGWDLELCLKSFAEQSTLDEGYLLLHLYGCLNIDKLLLQGKKGLKRAKGYVETLFNFTRESLLNNEMEKNYLSLKRAKFNPEGKFELEVHRLLKNIYTMEKKEEKPKDYNHYISEAFENRNLEKWPENTFSFEMMWSICNGTVMAKLLNSLTDSVKKKEGNEEYIPDEKLMKGYVREILLNSVKLVIQLTKFYNQDQRVLAKEDVEKTHKSVLQALAELMGLIKDKSTDNKKLWDDFMRLALSIKPEPKEIAVSSMEKSLIDLHIVLQNENSLQEDAKFDVMMRIKDTVNLIIEEKDREFILNIINITTGRNVKGFNLKPGAVKASSQLSQVEMKERVGLLFTAVQKILFPEQNDPKFSEKLQIMSEISNKILQVYQDVGPESGHKSLIEPAKDIIKLIISLKEQGKDGLDDIMLLLRGYFYESRNIIKKISQKPELNSIIDSLTSSYNNARYVLNNAVEQQKKIVPVKSYQSKTNFDSDEWADIMKKIKEDKAKSTDLFKVLDAEGDKNGRISEDEFRTLANRLGLRLSQHRIKEIFAKVKGSKGDDTGEDTEERDLDEKEFEKALDYLQEKNLTQALQFLGITPEILTAILIRLTILLILIFVFIFLGIKAFAIGGTFGSIINSLFPAAGGMALGRDKDKNDEKLEDDNVRDATDKGFEITTKEEL